MSHKFYYSLNITTLLRECNIQNKVNHIVKKFPLLII